MDSRKISVAVKIALLEMAAYAQPVTRGFARAYATGRMVTAPWGKDHEWIERSAKHRVALAIRDGEPAKYLELRSE